MLKGSVDMRGFAEINPAALMLYYVLVIGIAMFCMNPVIIIISLISAAALYITLEKKKQLKLHVSFFLLFLILAVINPIWYHNGVTVLFVVNDSPVTLEALMYGIFAAAMIISVLYRFRTFTMIMTADKLMYVFGKISPKLALILSMALRYVPMMRVQTGKVRTAQKALGIYKEDNIADTLKGEMRIFSIMATWALENGIITADSMAARGYGEHKRTSFSVFRFTKGDVVFTLLCAALCAATFTALAFGELDFTFYPAMSEISASTLSVCGYTGYAVLSVLPCIIEWKEGLRWRYLLSKI